MKAVDCRSSANKPNILSSLGALMALNALSPSLLNALDHQGILSAAGVMGWSSPRVLRHMAEALRTFQKFISPPPQKHKPLESIKTNRKTAGPLWKQG